MAKIPCGKTRKIDEPYEIWTAMVRLGDEQPTEFTWRVLKKYQTPENEAKNPYARWFCAVSSVYTAGGYDYGDVYIKDITRWATAKMIKGEPDLRKVLRDEVDKKNIF